RGTALDPDRLPPRFAVSGDPMVTKDPGVGGCVTADGSTKFETGAARERPDAAAGLATCGSRPLPWGALDPAGTVIGRAPTSASGTAGALADPPRPLRCGRVAAGKLDPAGSVIVGSAANAGETLDTPSGPFAAAFTDRTVLATGMRRTPASKVAPVTSWPWSSAKPMALPSSCNTVVSRSMR